MVAVLLITLGIGQLIATHFAWRSASLVGPNRMAGYGLGTLLLVIGALSLPPQWGVLGWAPPAGVLALALLLWSGSYIAPPPHPDQLFTANHPAHGACQLVKIPDGEYQMPGYLLYPRRLDRTGAAVCLIPGAGDSKSSFKWRLVEALLAEGLIVLSIDPPGHGDYRQRPLAYPDCLSAVPAAIGFLRSQPEVTQVALVSISTGGALALRSLAEDPALQVDAVVILETPLRVGHLRTLIWQERWAALRAPVLSLLREISVRQMAQSWRAGGYRSQHTTAELIGLLDPLQSIARLKPDIPLLLVYGGRDPIASPQMAQAMQQAAANAELIMFKQASHVTLTLIPEVNRLVARWLSEHSKNLRNSQDLKRSNGLTEMMNEE
jgi:alpha-beta hydrolase superfamily lysophospholipase